ncbi:acetoin dehydrogenase [Rhodococcus sp. 14-2483-1-1]|uniref:SDR family NAD(P)-dependent oxidoreductase n=1 Tax=unclassified Rhodococcus (in: high G+C Gram-positive bacteria) TaxID=192944 RepID=UPI000B9B59E7|nr:MULTISPECIES: SDR family oxidoreductase [unclassified Rhodococcus (in: high G+C Gram-positive bacteria)]OZD01960.1 acetoin dehydrogenase [Rhodococcus sp. 06-235-1A]OZD67432.1 acetoin dehydrogenase [Rhodococcus sp. 05-340-2]OZD71881.1 acetoin dehydrogenase [Rhodococcus sp. 05-340-1]OZE27131.1 acetoin dehydrogenase [Rhodococcus sp. 05-2255-1e]OZF29090.1 acetoin dehydrogenase [Rhodococcus sp. 14-2483-1-1]
MPGEWKAAITGAGSGVGREIALQLAQQKWSLALADSNYDALLDTQSRCAATAAIARATRVDVSSRAEITSWAASSRNGLGGIDAVFNVAGVLYSGDVIDTPPADFDLVMATNFESVVNSSRAFLPDILTSRRGRIINVSSAFGVMSAPGYSAYNSSKFAVRGFTEALNQELRLASRTARATCVIPGGLKTSIARTARAAPGVDHVRTADFFDRRIARTTPEVAAQKIIAGAWRGKSQVTIGNDARLVAATTRVLGPHYQRLLPSLRALRRT